MPHTFEDLRLLECLKVLPHVIFGIGVCEEGDYLVSEVHPRRLLFWFVVQEVEVVHTCKEWL